MKDNKNINENVPNSICTRCSLANHIDYKDWEKRLRPLDIIPEKKKEKVLRVKTTPWKGIDGEYVDTKLELLPEFTTPASVREEQSITLYSPYGRFGGHFMLLLKGRVINFEKAWIFMSEDFVKELRKFPYKYHEKTVTDGEFFRLEDNDTFSLQDVEHFEGWKVLLKCEIDDKEFLRPEKPDVIILLDMLSDSQ